ncbi:MAG: S1 RNA-binding domain-containing protein, partial [Proteobacteria bacterium]|nr:S1 RNA-binding domain-containing protein [Pseudomonadota bacterium]
NDILDELAKPGRDPREKFEAFAFADGIEKIEDLRPGMKIPGIVTNITAFGAFVDIGVHQDGLVHVSQMADRFVKNPADIVKNQQKVTVTVLEVDLARNRISLSMKLQAEKSGTAVENHNPKPKNKDKKNLSSRNSPFNNPLAEALIKSGLK